ncbi:peptide methionine sulfoxide reductase [Aquimarina sp. TRL1]|uniref:peptide-methionine (S)-S-oxide reductase n=1 Tax=Aquimarina sp. (strain TRL1) TaxID=2736252 RepID=UPI00158E97CB|nr:peptide-methionine (S)-S-oxide reductase [Aquimarina sp. TRL1]QKX04265.1 peptide methionine sulfoxide reductase [Aquimarina sp. TRL1]
MKRKHDKIALGGGCHWCTEAVFQSLKGVSKVLQGYVASTGEDHNFSEAVIVHFYPEEISLHTLVEIHLYTHKSTEAHTMRKKYRSAIYFYTQQQHIEVLDILQKLQIDFKKPLVTKAYPFVAFKPSREAITNYYYTNPQRPFCQNFITPKLLLLLKHFSKNVHPQKRELLPPIPHKNSP